MTDRIYRVSITRDGESIFTFEKALKNFREERKVGAGGDFLIKTDHDVARFTSTFLPHEHGREVSELLSEVIRDLGSILQTQTAKLRAIEEGR